MGGRLGRMFFMPLMRSESLKVENKRGLSSRGLEKAMALQAAIAAKRLSLEPAKRLLGGSGSVGNFGTMGETKGVMVSDEVLGGIEDAELEESGLKGLSVKGGGRVCVIVSSEGGTGA